MKITPVANANLPASSTSDGGHLRVKSKGADFNSEFSRARNLVGNLDNLMPTDQAGSIATPSGNSILLAVNYPASIPRIDPASVGINHGARASSPVAFHTVKYGETLYGITRNFLEGTGLEANPKAIMRSLSRLSESNGIKDQNRIHPGQVIYLFALIDSIEKSPQGPIQASTHDMPGKLRSIVDDVKNAASSLTIVRGAIDAGVSYTQPTAGVDYPVRTLDLNDKTPGKDGSVSSRYAHSSLSESPENVLSLSAGISDDAPIFEVDGGEIANDQPAHSVNFSTDASRTSDLTDLMYKGALGKALDYLPIQTEDRVAMQQAGSLVNGTLTGIKLSGLLNIATPVAAVFGFLWGVFSAKNISHGENMKPPQ